MEEMPLTRQPASRAQALSLLEGLPRAVLARLTDGDPLGVRAVVGARLRERSQLFDADRIHLRALALIAREAGSFSGRPALGSWVGDRVERALDEVLLEARKDTLDSEVDAPGAAGAFGVLGAPLGLRPAAAQAATLALNQLPQPERRAFLGLVIESRPLDELAAEESASAREVGRRARRALDSILEAARQHSPPEEPA